MNPGAPEFTPRSTAAPNLANASPVRHSWAEDVKEEATAHEANLESASISTAIRACEASPSSKHDDQNSSIIHPEPAVQSPTPAPQEPDRKLRRNTLQSVSCSEPPAFCLQESPTRSVSQPMPTPPALPSTIENAKPPQASKEPAPASSDAREPPRGPARGRGGFRGRTRGRYRGGRGSRRGNASSPKLNQKGSSGVLQRRGESTPRAR